MTRKEAIKCIRDMQDGMPFDKCEDWIEALHIAINSMEVLTKFNQEILKAGLRGEEVRFYINGRLFSVRELAQ